VPQKTRAKNVDGGEGMKKVDFRKIFSNWEEEAGVR